METAVKLGGNWGDEISEVVKNRRLNDSYRKSLTEVSLGLDIGAVTAIIRMSDETGQDARERNLNRMTFEDSKVIVNDSKGKEIASRDYTKVVFEKGDGSPEERLSAALGRMQADDSKSNPIDSLLTYVTRAYDLSTRGTIRAALVRDLEGPDKAIEKAAKIIMSVNPKLTLDAAMNMVRQSMGLTE